MTPDQIIERAITRIKHHGHSNSPPPEGQKRGGYTIREAIEAKNDPEEAKLAMDRIEAVMRAGSDGQVTSTDDLDHFMTQPQALTLLRRALAFASPLHQPEGDDASRPENPEAH